MTPRNMKIRVPVATLIEGAEAHRRRIVDDHAAAVAAYADAHRQWAAEVMTALDIAQSAAERGEYPEVDARWRGEGENLLVPIAVARPVQPTEQPNTRQVDRDLTLLRASADDTLSISADDNFGRYLS